MIAGIAVDGVGELVAGEVDGAGAERVGGRHPLDADPGRQPIAHAGVHAIERCACAGDDRIVGVVDEVDVVAGATLHGVVADAAVERVVAGGAAAGRVIAVDAADGDGDGRGVAAGHGVGEAVGCGQVGRAGASRPGSASNAPFGS